MLRDRDYSWRSRKNRCPCATQCWMGWSWGYRDTQGCIHHQGSVTRLITLCMLISQEMYRMTGFLLRVECVLSVITEVRGLLLDFGAYRLAGAGTTAIGLRNGLPTIVVPFFGDQQYFLILGITPAALIRVFRFWGDMLHDSGAGPSPISPKTLTVERLSSAILFCLSDDARAAARNLGDIIKSEDGLKRGVSSFHRHLPLLNMRCVSCCCSAS